MSNRKNKLLIFCGLSAVGKSTLAAALHKKYGFVCIDKDDPSLPTNSIIHEKIVECAKAGVDFWKSDEYRQTLMPQLYSELFSETRRMLRTGASCIIDAPLSSMVRDKNFLQDAKNLTKAEHIYLYWFSSSPEKIKQNMISRDAVRDKMKISDEVAWAEYIAHLDFSFRPPFEHKYIDTSETTPEALLAQFERDLGLSA